MALNKNIQCIPCINKNNPSQGKTFYKMESLELSTRFVTDSEHKQSINQTLSLASRDYFYAKNYLSYSPIKTHLRSKTKISLHYTLKKCTLREQILILLSYPNKLSPKHIKWKLVPDFSSKH